MTNLEALDEVYDSGLLTRGEGYAQLRRALEALEAVEVLDDWAERQDKSGQVTVYNSDGLHWCCGLHGRSSRGYLGKTPAEARIAAAAAIKGSK